MTATDASIRPFRPEDLPALQEVRRAAFAPVFRSFRDIVGERVFALALTGAEVEQARLLEGLCGPGSAHEVLVATVDGAGVVGFVAFSVDQAARAGEIGVNAVHPDHAGRGIGTAMYGRALTLMKERGAVVASVGTGGDPSHAPARRTYGKAGFGPAIPSVTLYKLL